MFWMLLHVVWGNVRHLLAPSRPRPHLQYARHAEQQEVRQGRELPCKRFEGSLQRRQPF